MECAFGGGMSGEESSVRDLWGALSLLTRRLDDLAASVARLEPTPGSLPGELLDESTRRALSRLTSVLGVVPGGPTEAALRRALDRLVDRGGADCAAVFRAGLDGGLEAVASRGFPEEPPSASSPDGIVGRAFREREVIRGREADQDRDALIHQAGARRALAVPIRGSASGSTGVLFVGRRRPVDFDLDALEVAVLVADRIGLILAPEQPGAAGAPVPTPAMFDLDLGHVGEAIVHEVAVRLEAPAVALLVPETGGMRIVASVGVPRPVAEADPAAPALRAAEETRLPWIAADGPGAGGPGNDSLGRLLGAPVRLVLPLLAGEAVVGFVIAGGGGTWAPVSSLVPLLAGAGSAVRNARLHEAAVAALAGSRDGWGQRVGPGPSPARDFSSLLAVVLGRLASVHERVVDPAVVRDVEVAEEAAWRAAEAVRGLLGFPAERRAETPGPLDVAEVIREGVARARTRWAARRGPPPLVKVDLAPLPPILGVAEELAEALDRLLENAVEATGGKAVSVRARWDGGSRVEILVEDRGQGMDDGVRSRAGEPFFSTKGAGRLGLGLPVAQAIVARHRGVLEIDSAVGIGTTVRVTLPTLSGTDGPASRPTAPSDGASGILVLVVEDESAVRGALVEALEQHGYAALTASRASDAVALVDREAIDVVFTDLALPDGSGLEVARAVKRARPGVRIVLLTGWPGCLEASAVSGSGVDVVIEKPVGLAEVQAALATVLSGRSPARP